MTIIGTVESQAYIMAKQISSVKNHKHCNSVQVRSTVHSTSACQAAWFGK